MSTTFRSSDKSHTITKDVAALGGLTYCRSAFVSTRPMEAFLVSKANLAAVDSGSCRGYICRAKPEEAEGEE